MQYALHTVHTQSTCILTCDPLLVIVIQYNTALIHVYTLGTVMYTCMYSIVKIFYC